MDKTKKRIFGIGVTAAIAVITFAFAIAASGSDGGVIEQNAEGVTVAASEVTSSISYQGRLADSAGEPLSGTYDMTFRLYEYPSSTALDTDTHSVEVTEGLFNTDICFDQNYFDGRELWLGIIVEGEVMTPRQEFKPVPYALSLRPGAVINGSVSGSILEVNNDLSYGEGILIGTTGENSDGVVVRTQGAISAGVWAETYGDLSAGVAARTYGNLSPGVFVDTSGYLSDGVSVRTSGDESAGVFVNAKGDEGTGVFVSTLGENSTGVYAYTTGDSSEGVWIKTTGKDSPGVTAFTYGDNSYGVTAFTYGDSSTGIGVGTTGVNSTGIGVGTTGDNGLAVYAFTHGEGSEGVYVNTTGDNSVGVRADIYGKSSQGVRANTMGDDSPGVFAYTRGDNSYGLSAVTFGDLSSGVAVATSGDDSPGVFAESAKSDGIYAETDRYDHKYGVRTPDKMYADYGYDTSSSDVAEYFAVAEDVEPGTVVVIGEDSKLQCSTTAYDTTVAGIVSTAPGVSLGTNETGNAGEKLIAVAGRVPCKVDASYAAIKPGDLLTTSDTQGHAMKAQPVVIGEVEIYRPRTTLGKALEPLDSGTGVIEVLVTLQ
jgi:hypothetical protein